MLPCNYCLADIDECEEENNDCAQTCSNTIGSYTCGCNLGYQLATDQRSCLGKCLFLVKGRQLLILCFSSDINECTMNNGGCKQNCNNTDGSFSCFCASGYSLDSNGLNCSGKFVFILVTGVLFFTNRQ